MQQTRKTAWTCVPFTSIMVVHFYLVDVRQFQNHILVCFLAILWRSLYLSTLGSRLVWLKGAPALIRWCYSK